MEKLLIIKNEISEIEKLTEFVEGIGEDFGLKPSLVMSFNLVLEEAISNIVLYAYPQKMGDEICIKACKINNTLVFTISDKGVEFDPTKTVEADISLSAEDRPIGGLGIFLIKKIMDEVIYQRIDNTNVLTIKKNV